MSKITEYFKETKSELKHVNWPGKKLTILYTIVVLATSIIVAYFLGLFDFIFSRGLEKLISF
jgi:preprotein translocase subunit SecE